MSLESNVADAQETALYRLPAILGRPTVAIVDWLLLIWSAVWATLSWSDLVDTRSMQSFVVAIVWTVIGVGIVTFDVYRRHRDHVHVRRELMHWAAKAGAQKWEAHHPTEVFRRRTWRYHDGYWWLTEQQ